MKKMVLGLAFSSSFDSVLLMKKDHPPHLAGKWNGVGGKLKPGERPEHAMQRECREETGLDFIQWVPFCDLSFPLAREGTDGEPAMIRCFTTHTPLPELLKARTVEQEQVKVHTMLHLQYSYLMPNLRWLIPMALNANVLSYASSGFQTIVAENPFNLPDWWS